MALTEIFTALRRTLDQIGDPRFRRVLLLGVGLALAGLAIFFGSALWLLNGWLGESISLPWIGEVHWLADAASWSGAVAFVLLSALLMVPVASAITGLFIEQVADAVEDRHYPGTGPATPVPFGDQIVDSLNYLGLMLAVNIAALVLYVLFAPFALLIFWSVNGFLLGREYFQMAAMRRVGRAGAKALRRKHALTIWAAGTLMAMPLSLPIVNLVVPILGAAVFTHLFHLLPGLQAPPYDPVSPDRAR